MKRLVLYIFLALPILLFSQGGFRSQLSISGTTQRVAKGIFETTPGNYFAGGIIHDTMNGAGFNQLAILGLNSFGNVQWIKKYGSKKFQYLDGLFFGSRSFYRIGNSVFHTSCVRDSNNKQIGALVKFSLNGDSLWQKTYIDSNRDVIPQSLTASVDGGILLTGFFQDWINNSNTCLVIKTDINGNELWRKSISKVAPNTQEGKAIFQDSASKKILIVGYQYIGSQSSASTYDNVLILDSVGNTLSQKQYNSGYLLDLIQTKDKKIIAVGVTESYSSSDNEYYHNSYMVKFDINNPNVPLWKSPYFDQVAKINNFSCIKELPNGDILIAGSIDSLKASDTVLNTKVRFIKINPTNGNVLWRKDYDYPINNNSPYTEFGVTSLEATDDGGWVASIRVNNIYSTPLLYVKYDSTGCDTSAEWCKSVALGVSQFERSFGWHFDIYPNPSSKFIHLSAEIPLNKNLDIEVNDLTGRLIEKFRMETKSKEIDVSGYKDGVYLFSIIYEGRVIESKRLIVNKN